MDQINTLDEHILVEIFGNLSPRMIKACALVCKRWDEIIGSSNELMRRFKLDLSWKYGEKVFEVKSLKRKHRTVKIPNLGFFLSMDVSCRQNMQELVILYDSKATLSLLIETLNNLPLLKKFHANYKHFRDDLSGSKDSFKMVNTNLIELSCDAGLIKVFNCFTVRKLKLTFENPDDHIINERIVDFLKKSTKLTQLNLFGSYSSEFFTLPNIFEFELSLKEFKLFCAFKPFLHYEAFIKFLNCYKNSLNSLEVNFFTDPQFGIEFIHKYALENIVNLKHLELGYFQEEDDGYIGDELSYHEIPEATQITKKMEGLVIRARSPDINENRRFYDMFPNLKYLNFGTCDNEECTDLQLLHCISERCLNLEQLVLTYMDNEIDFPGTIYFPKLKEFTIHNCYSEEVFCAFINRHSQTLEKLCIEDVDYMTYLTAKEILRCPNLTYLKVDNPTLSILGMFDEISTRKVFTLDIKGLNGRFIFPDDKAIWDEEIGKLDEKFHQNFCTMQ